MSAPLHRLAPAEGSLAAEARAPVRRPRPPILWLPLSLWSLAIIAGLVHLAERRAEPAPAAPALETATPSAPPAAWETIPRALPVYTFEVLPDWKKLPLMQEARRHGNGGREDLIDLGGTGEPFRLRIVAGRGLTGAPQPSFYVDLVRRAAEAGFAVERSAAPQPFPTKFGTAEAAPVSFGGPFACLAFRFAHPELAFRLHGWLCGSERLSVTDDHLACVLDQLALAGGEDAALRVLFAGAEGWRTGACAVARWEPKG